mmetsp:Transcript_30714/g.69282  ORF Transcript_30714/g.69282 Transcript_30714/m.69282 type:complete len:194 (-) Transcript_30714:96-677(-)
MIIISSSLMYYLEKDTPQSEYTSIASSMWWSVTALTTVGYGDIYPKSAAGKVLGALVAFIGIGFFALPAGIVGSGFVELTEQERLKRKRSKLLQQRGLHSAHTVTDCSSRDTQMTSTQMEDGLELVTLQQVLRAITSQQIQLARTLLDERIAVLSGQDITTVSATVEQGPLCVSVDSRAVGDTERELSRGSIQ